MTEYVRTCEQHASMYKHASTYDSIKGPRGKYCTIVFLFAREINTHPVTPALIDEWHSVDDVGVQFRDHEVVGRGRPLQGGIGDVVVDFVHRLQLQLLPELDHQSCHCL